VVLAGDVGGKKLDGYPTYQVYMLVLYYGKFFSPVKRGLMA